MDPFDDPLHAPCCQVPFANSPVFRPCEEGLALCAGGRVGIELETVDGVGVCVCGGASVLEQGETVGRGMETAREARVRSVLEFVVWFDELGGAEGGEDGWG
jgi:hypothetical protein